MEPWDVGADGFGGQARRAVQSGVGGRAALSGEFEVALDHCLSRLSVSAGQLGVDGKS